MNLEAERLSSTVTVEVDGVELPARPGAMLIEVTDEAGIYVPRFCYHKKLSVAANCRMCLVEVENSPKPLPACATPVRDGMRVFTQSEQARAAQRGVMEFLLINHPLDCPICDQGGECELQDLALGFGRSVSRFAEKKRVVEDKDVGPLIKTDMTRCIHCTRCVRFLEQIAGKKELGATGRGEHMEIGTYIQRSINSELSGNIIDICPVGALTDKPFRFKARSWEMTQTPSVSPHDCVGTNIYLHSLRGRVMRVVPRENEGINEVWISDRDRYGREGLYVQDRLSNPSVRDDRQWSDVDFEVAFDRVADGLNSVLDRYGADEIGFVLSSSATLEELYMARRIADAIGCPNIDHRLWQGDFSDDDAAPAYPSLGQSLVELEQSDVIIMVGSEPRREQPLVGHRVRNAALGGCSVWFVNLRRIDPNFRESGQLTGGVNEIATHLAGVAASLVLDHGRTVPEGLNGRLTNIEPSDEQRVVATNLVRARRASIVLGSQVTVHPGGSTIRALASGIAELSGATLGFLPEGGNSPGAWLAGAVPHRGAGGRAAEKRGLDARAMFDNPRRAYILFGVEPELDAWDGARALNALKGADFVVSLCSYDSTVVRDYSDVLLPVALIPETDGTLINIEGVWQEVKAAGRPPGEARPGWKIWRVIGNYLNVPNFDYVMLNEVHADITKAIYSASQESAARPFRPPMRDEGEEVGFARIGGFPIYATDPMVRRAEPLQRTDEALQSRVAVINRRVAESIGVRSNQQISITQNGRSIRLAVRVDDGVPDNCVWLPAGIPETAALGPLFGRVDIKHG